MEALLASSIISSLLLSLGGWMWGGLARWVLMTLGAGALFVAVPSQICKSRPDICPTDLLQQFPQAIQPITDWTAGSVQPVGTAFGQLSESGRSLIPTPTPSPSPSPSPTPSPSPSPGFSPSPSPGFSPTPSPSYGSELEPCADGECVCVDNKCLW